MSASAAPPSPVQVTLHSEDETTLLARRLAMRVGAGDVLLLQGPIGAGKTHFARSLIQARLARVGAQEDVPSPTFTLVQIYEAGPLEIWHADLYRLTSPDEVLELGLEEAFEAALCLVEWPDRLGDLAPVSALSLQFSQGAGETERRLIVSATDPRWVPVMEELSGA